MKNFLSFLKSKKHLLLIPLAIILFIILRATLLRAPSSVLTYTVRTENLIDTVQASGTYTTASQTQIYSPTNGIITQIFVTNGQQVQKGDPLFHVEATATDDQKKYALAAYQSALSSLQTARNTKESLDATMWTKQKAYLDAQKNEDYKNRRKDISDPDQDKDYNNFEKLSIDSALTQAKKDFNAAEQAYTTADSAVGAAASEVNLKKLAMDETRDTTVTSPASGTIVNLLSRIGDQISAPSSTSPTGLPASSITSKDPVLLVANLNNPYINLDISEDYAARINKGQKAQIVFDSLKNHAFSGQVTDIATVGTITDGIVTYNARLALDQTPPNIKPNMTALVTIETLRKNHILTVPNSAIIQKNGQNYVMVQSSRSLTPVTLGIKGIAKTEITSGLSNATVIIANPE